MAESEAVDSSSDDSRGDTETSPRERWTHVASPDESDLSSESTDEGAAVEESNGGSTEGGRRAFRRRRPSRLVEEDARSRRRFLVVAAIVTVVLLLAASAGGYLVNRLSPATQIIQTVTPTPTVGTWPLALPVTVGEYSRNANEGASPSTGADRKQTVSAQYSKNGQDPVVILLSRPETDGPTFMEQANMNAVAEVDGGWCGISGDNNLDGCAVIVDGTAILVLGLADIGRTPLMALTKQVATQVSGR